MDFLPNIPYIELTDFNQDLTLKPHVGKDKPVVIMCQGVFCHFCKDDKPDFLAFCQQVNGQIVGATIQIDNGKENLSGIISTLYPAYKGVPIYMGFNKNGKYVKTHEGNRDTTSLVQFAQSL